jgi:hypothetical protein
LCTGYAEVVNGDCSTKNPPSENQYPEGCVTGGGDGGEPACFNCCCPEWLVTCYGAAEFTNFFTECFIPNDDSFSKPQQCNDGFTCGGGGIAGC